MKRKNLNILILMVSAVFFQACGELPVQGGFTEETIDTSNSNLTPGIQEGICEETDQDFTFKTNVSGTTYMFTKSTGLIMDPNGNEYIESKNTGAEEKILNKSYECIMEISEGSEEITFNSTTKKTYRVRLTRGTALVN